MGIVLNHTYIFTKAEAAQWAALLMRYYRNVRLTIHYIRGLAMTSPGAVGHEFGTICDEKRFDDQDKLLEALMSVPDNAEKIRVTVSCLSLCEMGRAADRMPREELEVLVRDLGADYNQETMKILTNRIKQEIEDEGLEYCRQPCFYEEIPKDELLLYAAKLALETNADWIFPCWSSNIVYIVWNHMVQVLNPTEIYEEDILNLDLDDGFTWHNPFSDFESKHAPQELNDSFKEWVRLGRRADIPILRMFV